jgi:hypothetical protein
MLIILITKGLTANMARSQINQVKTDLLSDPGSVLFSFVLGEQLQYPLDIEFISTTVGYNFEAVVIEADNTDGQTEAPTTHKTGGVQVTLPLLIPTNMGTWSAVTAYNEYDIAFYNTKWYRLKLGAGYISATTPDVDTTHWEETSAGRIYVRFPKTLGSTWTVKPTVTSKSYGFFELRVTEAAGAFPLTWKPVRGMVELSFSPTDIVPDV